MKNYTNSEIASYIRNRGWTGKYPSIEECNTCWSDVSLEEGYVLFKASRNDFTDEMVISEIAIIKDWCSNLQY